LEHGDGISRQGQQAGIEVTFGKMAQRLGVEAPATGLLGALMLADYFHLRP
jgi:hypothetical protein